MDGFIVTGASRGLGLGFVQELIGPGRRLRCVSRNVNDRVLEQAKAAGCDARWFCKDLARVYELDGLMEEIFESLDPMDTVDVTLINNAGVVGPIGPMHRAAFERVVSTININLTAVMLLCSSFARLASPYRGGKTVINVTTGAARHPYQGMCPYCVTKAGVDMFTRCAALEESGVRVVAVAPGVLDTDMQRETRSANAEGFAEKQRFMRLETEGKLGSPQDAARRILRLVADGLSSGSVVDIRDLSTDG